MVAEEQRGRGTSVEVAVRAYDACRSAYDLIDTVATRTRCDSSATREMFRAQLLAVAFAVKLPPASLSDLMLQVGVASSFFGILADRVEDSGSVYELALGIGVLLENATVFLAENVECPPALEGIRDYHKREAIRAGSGPEAAA